MQYKGSHKDIAGSARSWDWTMSWRQRAPRGRPGPNRGQLIQVSDQTHVWSKTYDAEMRHVLKFRARWRRWSPAISRSPCLRPANATRRCRPGGPRRLLEGLVSPEPAESERVGESGRVLPPGDRKDAAYAQAHAKLALGQSLAVTSGMPRPRQLSQGRGGGVQSAGARQRTRRRSLRAGSGALVSHLDLVAAERTSIAPSS